MDKITVSGIALIAFAHTNCRTQFKHVSVDIIKTAVYQTVKHIGNKSLQQYFGSLIRFYAEHGDKKLEQVKRRNRFFDICRFIFGNSEKFKASSEIKCSVKKL